MSHYYTDNRQLPHNRKEISFRFSGFNLIFETDNGVFSKDGVDTGTKILLNVLKEEALSGEILDLGCGYGAIGIFIKKAFEETKVTMSDINPRAVELSVSNAQRNDVDCKILVSDGFKNLDHSYNVIITNPPIRTGKATIYSMFEYSIAALKPNGSLWFVMRKQHGALSAIKKLEELNCLVEIKDKDKGFLVIKAQNTNIDNLTLL